MKIISSNITPEMFEKAKEKRYSDTSCHKNWVLLNIEYFGGDGYMKNWHESVNNLPKNKKIEYYLKFINL